MVVKQHTFLSHTPEGWKSELKLWAQLVSPETSPWLISIFSPGPHRVIPLYTVYTLIASFYKDIVRLDYSPPKRSDFILITS